MKDQILRFGLGLVCAASLGCSSSSSNGGATDAGPRAAEGTGAAGTCVGVPGACADQKSKDTCGAVGGCSWPTTYCLGAPVPCDQATNDGACAARPGCTWSPGTTGGPSGDAALPDSQPGSGCSGAAAQCAQLTSSQCPAQAGCVLSGGACKGSAQGCGTIGDEPRCRAQRGCGWQ